MGFGDIKLTKDSWVRKGSKSTSHSRRGLSAASSTKSHRTSQTPQRLSHIRYSSPPDPSAKPRHLIPASVGPSVVEAPPSYSSFYTTEAHGSNSPLPSYANSAANETMAHYTSPRQRQPQRGRQTMPPCHNNLAKDDGYDLNPTSRIQNVTEEYDLMPEKAEPEFEEDEELQQEILAHFNSVHAKKLQNERKAVEEDEETQQGEYARLNSLHTAKLEEERRAAELQRQLGSVDRGQSDQSKSKFDCLWVADLKQECKDRDLNRKGNRRALIQRLEDYESTPSFILRGQVHKNCQRGYASGFNNIIEFIRKPVIKRVRKVPTTTGAQATGEQFQDAMSRLALVTTEDITENSWADGDRSPRRAELPADPFVDYRSSSPGPHELPAQVVRHKLERNGNSLQGDRERFRLAEHEDAQLRSRLRFSSRNSSSSSSRSDFWSADGRAHAGGVDSRQSPPTSGNSSERENISPTEETFANDPPGGGDWSIYPDRIPSRAHPYPREVRPGPHSRAGSDHESHHRRQSFIDGQDAMVLAQEIGRERPRANQEMAPYTRGPLDPYDQYVSALREEILPHRTRSTRHENQGETQQVSTRSQDEFWEQEPEVAPRRIQAHRTQYEDLESTPRQSARTPSRGHYQDDEAATPPRRSHVQHQTQYRDDDRESTPRATSRARSPEQELTPRRRIEEGVRYVIPQRKPSPARPIGEPVQHARGRDPVF